LKELFNHGIYITIFCQWPFLLGIDWLFDGIQIEGYGTALIFIIILSVLNILVKPILHIISLPITLLTLGLFSFLINAFVFYLSSQFVSGFHIEGFFTTLLASILFSLGQSVFASIEKE